MKNFLPLSAHITIAASRYFYSFYLKICVIFSGFFFLTFSSFSQNTKTDSLLQVLKTAKQDTNKVNILNELSHQFYLIGDYGTEMDYSVVALTLAQHIKYKKGVANSLNSIGSAYDDQGNYADALKNYFASLKIRREIGDYGGMASSYNNIGIIYMEQGNYPDALKNYFASLKIREEVGDKNGIASSFNNIGNIYMWQSNYAAALKNYFAALKIKEEIGDKYGIATSYNNIGIIYFNQGNYPAALKNYFASLKIMEEIEDKYGIANSFNNIGIIYDKQGNYPAALKNYFAGLKIEDEIGDKKGVADSYINLGSIKLKMANVPKSSFNKEELHIQAKKYLDAALLLSKEIGSKESIKESYNNMAALDSARATAAIAKRLWPLGVAYLGKSLEHYKMYIIYRDSIDNEETKEKTIQSSMNFEFEKKEALTKAAQDKKDALAATEMKKQQIIRYAVSGILVLVILFTFFLYNRFRLIRRQKNIIEIQKQVVEQQRHLAEESRKEIVDSINYAKRIQYALLAKENTFIENLSSHFVFFKPKDIVSGDFYWATVYGDDFYLAVCDSTGHGVPGAFMSLLSIGFLSEAIKEKNIMEPNKVFDYIRKRLIESISNEDQKDGFDGILLRINKVTGKVTYAASNNRPVLMSNSIIQNLNCDKMPVGKGERLTPFSEFEINHSTGDTIYLYTDGYADQFGGAKGKKFKYKPLNELLLTINHLNLSDQQHTLDKNFTEWKGDLEQVDDVLIIGIKL